MRSKSTVQSVSCTENQQAAIEVGKKGREIDKQANTVKAEIRKQENKPNSKPVQLQQCTSAIADTGSKLMLINVICASTAEVLSAHVWTAKV